MRLGQLGLTRNDLTDDGILVQTQKTDKGLLIEWSDELRDVIDRAKRLPPHIRQPIIATRKGRAYTGDGFSAIWQRVVKKSEVRFQFKDLRAKSASDDTLEGATKRLGHTSSQTTERFYRRKPNRVRPLK